ncbi:MAG: ABC transporter ATP-binding protein [Pseudomonadota bacterium]
METERVQKSPMPCLAVEMLSKGFRVNGHWSQVLQAISFEVAEGEIVALLGPSGCGKTTLLNIVAGFLPQDRGRVLVKGQAVAGPGPDRGVVFQEDALFSWLTVAENVDLGLKRSLGKAVRHDRVKRMLDMVELGDYAGYLPRDISGGMKQRVALARVLVLQPMALLMDEPFAALDAQTRSQMHKLVLSLQNRLQQSVLLVTHDPEEAVKLADRVLVMEKAPGRLSREFTVGAPRPRQLDSPVLLDLKRAIITSLAGSGS